MIVIGYGVLCIVAQVRLFLIIHPTNACGVILTVIFVLTDCIWGYTMFGGMWGR